MKTTFLNSYPKRLAVGSSLAIALFAFTTLIGTFKGAAWIPWFWLYNYQGLPEHLESRPFLSLTCVAICLALAGLSRPTTILFMAWVIINHLGSLFFMLLGSRS